MAYDSIKAAREQGFTRSELKTWLTGSLRELNAFEREHPAEYQERHKLAERLGIIGPSLYKAPAPYTKNYAPSPRQYSSDELVARGRHSEAETRAYFADSKKSNEDFHSDRNTYEDWRESGVAFGMFEPRVIPYVPVKPAEPEPLHRISDLLADESHLERGTTLPWEQVQQLVAQKVQRDRQAQETESAKAEADRQAEIGKLSAAQKLEQDKRDKEVRDLDRLAQLIAPRQVETPEPIALAVARAVAAEKQAA